MTGAPFDGVVRASVIASAQRADVTEATTESNTKAGSMCFITLKIRTVRAQPVTILELTTVQAFRRVSRRAYAFNVQANRDFQDPAFQ